MKLGTREQEEVSRLCEEVQLLRAELGSVQGGLGAREARDRRELQTRLQSHQEVIADIKTELQYQVQSSYNETFLLLFENYASASSAKFRATFSMPSSSNSVILL